jgi:hypothetical protein
MASMITLATGPNLTGIVRIDPPSRSSDGVRQAGDRFNGGNHHSWRKSRVITGRGVDGVDRAPSSAIARGAGIAYADPSRKIVRPCLDHVIGKHTPVGVVAGQVGPSPPHEWP